MVPTALLQRRLPDMAQRYVKYRTAVGTVPTVGTVGT